VSGQPHGTRRSGEVADGRNRKRAEEIMKVKTNVKAGSAVWGS
jgi:hypothetical protein